MIELKKSFENLKLRSKILILIVFINMVTTLFYTYFTYNLNKAYAINSIDERLKSAIYGTYNILTKSYHDRIINKDSISKEEYSKILKELSDFAKDVKVAYVYSMIKRDGKVLFTSSSAMEEDTIDEFFDEYVDATPKLKGVFDAKVTAFEEYRDSFGYFRSVFIPFTNKYGEVYVIGADMEMSYVNHELQEVIINSILIGMAVFIFAIVISILLINFIIKKIPIIQDGLIGFFKYLNREIPKAELIEIDSKDELGEMARVINENIKKIKVGVEKDNQLIDNITEISNNIKRGSLSDRIKGSANNPSLNRTKDVINEMLDSMEMSFENILEAINTYSSQDYTYAINCSSFIGEFKELIDGVNKLGKDISSVILKNAYDSLSLQRDSNYLKEFIEKINLSTTNAVSDMEKVFEIIEWISKNSENNIKKIELVKNETEDIKSTIANLNIKSKAIDEFISEIKFNSKEDEIKANTTLKDMEESIYDINFTLNRLDNFMKDVLDGIASQYDTIKEIKSLVIKLNNTTLSNSKMTQNTNLVAIELAKVSNRIREDVVSKNFVGKENIMIFLQYIDR